MKTKSIYPSGEPIYPHLLRCEGFAVRLASEAALWGLNGSPTKSLAAYIPEAA